MAKCYFKITDICTVYYCIYMSMIKWIKCWKNLPKMLDSSRNMGCYWVGPQRTLACVWRIIWVLEPRALVKAPHRASLYPVVSKFKSRDLAANPILTQSSQECLLTLWPWLCFLRATEAHCGHLDSHLD